MVGVGGPLVVQFLVIAVLINVTLFIFNLIPIGPLDGMWILGTFLPEKSRYEWTKFNLTIGQFVFLALVLIPVGSGSIISMILMPLREFIVRLLL
jgi:Zn-dependent protease